MKKYPSWEKEYARAYRKKRQSDPVFRAKKSAAAKAWAIAHPEIRKAYTRSYYLKNKEKIKAAVKTWKKKNHDKIKKARRGRYRAKYLHYITKSRQYYQKRMEAGKTAAYRVKNRDAAREYSREKSAQITDLYAREQLAKYSPISAKDFPQEIVDAKKIHLKLKRLLKQKTR